MQIRDRYAPSPTGLQHIGGIRTALFNYLLARSERRRSGEGAFILRLEDTDRGRFDPRYVENLYDTFAWLGIRWDEGPDVGGPGGSYIQSERIDVYKKYALELLARDRAYYCFCSSERLERLREEREAAHGSQTGYDRHCRDIDPPEARRRVEAGEPCTVRLKIPLGEHTRFRDQILGDVEWKNDDVNPDPVLIKSDGFPTYHLANVVDDHLMGITHVLRAQEWLSSTPLHVIMYGAFGWKPPEFCHLPLIMGTDGKKLSKRHGATSVDEFRSQGCLSEALINYVALLGASYEEGKDIYTLEELEERFSLDKLNKAPAIFDYKKLEWYNGVYIRMKSDGELAELCLPYALRDGLFGGPGREPDEKQRVLFTRAMPLIRERLVYLSEAAARLGYLFAEPEVPPAEEFIPKKGDLAAAAALLRRGRELVKDLAEAAGDEEAEALVKDYAEKNTVKLGDLMMPLRVAITGARVSPPLFGSLRLLGTEKSLERVDRALAKLA
ncbi:MAG: glutamate--tRNA ligase [Treponema sp.]|jgi:glutamyl-tRNA synthetase|nr:glutamate--tRNA ligase [Treponema sp.]